MQHCLLLLPLQECHARKETLSIQMSAAVTYMYWYTEFLVILSLSLLYHLKFNPFCKVVSYKEEEDTGKTCKRAWLSFLLLPASSPLRVSGTWSHDWVTQMEKDLGRTLVQPPAQSKVNINRTGCSRICPIQYGEAAPTLICPYRKNLFFISSLCKVDLLHTISAWNTSCWAGHHQDRTGLSMS